MTPAEKQRLVDQVQKHQGAGRASLAESADRFREELENDLLAEGVPESIILYMRAVHRERQALRGIARELFPVQSLPDGAIPFYDRDPEVVRILVEDDSEAGA